MVKVKKVQLKKYIFNFIWKVYYIIYVTSERNNWKEKGKINSVNQPYVANSFSFPEFSSCWKDLVMKTIIKYRFWYYSCNVEILNIVRSFFLGFTFTYYQLLCMYYANL